MSKRPWVAALRIVSASVLGYGVIALLTTLGFVNWLDNANLQDGGWLLKAKGMLVALVAGLTGGAVGAVIGGPRPVLHAVAVVPLLVVDTAYVLCCFPRTGPVWFDLAGALGLMAATVGGGFLVRTVRDMRMTACLT